MFSLLIALVTPLAADNTVLPAPIAPMVRVVDLNVGEHAEMMLHDGSTASVTLNAVTEHRERLREAVLGATLDLTINGTPIMLESGPYRAPVTVAGVQVDCTATSGLSKNGDASFWGLEKNVRLRLWPEGSALLQPDSMIYPVQQGWHSTRTWFDNEIVNAGTELSKQIYYHAGMDIGATEGLAQVVAATDALVVQRGESVLPGHEKDTPTSPRYDVVYLLDGRGWYYRYSHLKEIAPNVQPGALIRQGDPVGIVGKEGASGGWSHLHFEIKSRQPSGKWGTQAAYAFLREAYAKQFGLTLYANARPALMIVAGESAVLDGSGSWSADASIVRYEWLLPDGTQEGAKMARTYPKPGFYEETLKVTDRAGNTSYDFACVMVLDPDDLTHYAPSLNINHHPSRGLKPGDEITFNVRAFNMKGGEERWEFGDGSPATTTRSPEEAAPLAPEGYAEITHRYESPGDYIVSVRRNHENGQIAETKAWIRVAAP